MMPMERSIANATGVETRNCPDWRRGEPHRFGAAPRTSNSLPGGHSEREPPDPIPNSEVKTLCADGSVPFRHARVGHRQASNRKALRSSDLRAFFHSVRAAPPGLQACSARRTVSVLRGTRRRRMTGISVKLQLKEARRGLAQGRRGLYARGCARGCAKACARGANNRRNWGLLLISMRERTLL